MSEEIKVPSLGESENEATLVAWLKEEGEEVRTDDVVAEIESDKVTMEITALASGALRDVRKQAGDTVEPGEVIGMIEPGGTSAAPAPKKKTPGKQKAAEEKRAAAEEIKVAEKRAAEASKPVVKPIAGKVAEPAATAKENMEGRTEERVAMSGLRKRLASRLKEAQNTAAILTTFNEINMQPVTDLRSRYRDAFKQKHGVGLGLMSFFVKACIEGLKEYPAVNAAIDGEDVLYRNYFDIGIAVSTGKGLVVPVLRDAGLMDMAMIEEKIADFATRAREGGLMPDELKGGTFSISNGGVFGSLLSVPILNPPQSAILGMHAIRKRPVVESDEIVIRPMMYVALSYDHRLIDGHEAVRFLATVKETLEYPGKLLLGL